MRTARNYFSEPRLRRICLIVVHGILIVAERGEMLDLRLGERDLF